VAAHVVGTVRVWDGGLGIWGGIFAEPSPGYGCCAAAGRTSPGSSTPQHPRCSSRSSIGRVGNYFNQELFGKPTTLPWALQIDPAHRPDG
jgi:prolipoprotein diacylglyceryltransferase